MRSQSHSFQRTRPIRFKSEDGTILAGVLAGVQTSRPRTAAVLAHGITVEKHEGGFYSRLAEILARANIPSMRFDFRGHGESGGASTEMTIAGEILDLHSAVRETKKRFAVRRPAVVGTSFGASVAVLWTAAHPHAASSLTLLCPVLDYRETFLNPSTEWGRKWFGQKALRRAAKSGFINVDGFKLGRRLSDEWASLRPFEIVRHLKIPILVIHGSADSMVPYAVAERAARHLSNGKFVAIPNSDHGFEGYEAIVYEEVRNWIVLHAPR